MNSWNYQSQLCGNPWETLEAEEIEHHSKINNTSRRKHKHSATSSKVLPTNADIETVKKLF